MAGGEKKKGKKHTAKADIDDDDAKLPGVVVAAPVLKQATIKQTKDGLPPGWTKLTDKPSKEFAYFQAGTGRKVKTCHEVYKIAANEEPGYVPTPVMVATSTPKEKAANKPKAGKARKVTPIKKCNSVEKYFDKKNNIYDFTQTEDELTEGDVDSIMESIVDPEFVKSCDPA